MRRVLGLAWQIPEEAITFIGPLRNGGRVIRGSMLLDRDVMRRALTFPVARRRPDFALILIDEDGDAGRRARLAAQLEDKDLAHAIGCAAPEFEAWLVGDHDAVRAHLGDVQAPAAVEALAPRRPKALIREWSAERGKVERDVRRSLAALCDPARLAERCPSFEALFGELRRKRPIG
jgi:hypothetical protein